jgi:hypothetical protein
LLAEAEQWNENSTLLQGVKPRRISGSIASEPRRSSSTMSDEEKVIEEERRMRRKTEKADKSYGEEGLWAEASSQEGI